MKKILHKKDFIPTLTNIKHYTLTNLRLAPTGAQKVNKRTQQLAKLIKIYLR